jgi:valyl-tRNA synthetase
MVPRGDRTGAILEPMLTDQWYVRIAPLAEPAIAAVESGSIVFVPDNWTKVYYEWMYNIRDWCVSRQLWWGHRIPAWHCQKCQEIIVARDAPAKCACGGAVEQDPDVLDTWFSSALWPFSTLGWPNETRSAHILSNVAAGDGFDILFFGWRA